MGLIKKPNELTVKNALSALWERLNLCIAAF